MPPGSAVMSGNRSSAMTPKWIIDHLGMKPHPEGGSYVETFRDSPADGGRGALTCIHFLLQAGEVSAWHRVDAAEVWHFAAGDPLILTMSPDGQDAEAFHLGPTFTGDNKPISWCQRIAGKPPKPSGIGRW